MMMLLMMAGSHLEARVKVFSSRSPLSQLQGARGELKLRLPNGRIVHSSATSDDNEENKRWNTSLIIVMMMMMIVVVVAVSGFTARSSSARESFPAAPASCGGARLVHSRSIQRALGWRLAGLDTALSHPPPTSAAHEFTSPGARSPGSSHRPVPES
ncbi:unnamed protein product [Lampetra fluviatilis]